jgi:hypothetical protein
MARLLRHATAALAASAIVLAGACTASAAGTGGAAFAAPVPPPAPPSVATIVNGRAVAPAGAPAKVRRVITAANRLVRLPYRWGGGHRAFSSRPARAYDCSGAVSYALYGGRLLTSPLDSTGLKRWGRRGAGSAITVYTSRSHAYVVVAGLRFDTSMHAPDAPRPATGPRWSAIPRSARGFAARHPAGL